MVALRYRVHVVGLLASAIGTVSLVVLGFGQVRAFRLATGAHVGLFQALPFWLAAVPVALWLGVAAASIVAPRGRIAAAVRGLLASALIGALLGLSDIAAIDALPSAGAFSRYSMGAGVWVSVFLAVAVIADSRRGVGERSWWSSAIVFAAPVTLVALIVSGSLSSLGMAAEFRNVSDEFWFWTGQHILYAFSSMAVAIIVGVTLGIVAFRNHRLAEPVFAATSIVQTIPGLAMVGILAVPLGLLGQLPAFESLGVGVIGWAPVVVALTLYALLVLVRNTFIGLSSVPAAAVDAGRGMGMTPAQLLRKVELPLAAPIMFAGTRTAFQQTIGNATLAYFVAAGSLGRPIFSGVSQQAEDLVLLGSVALVALALTVDVALRGAERVVVPQRARGGGR